MLVVIVLLFFCSVNISIQSFDSEPCGKYLPENKSSTLVLESMSGIDDKERFVFSSSYDCHRYFETNLSMLSMIGSTQNSSRSGDSLLKQSGKRYFVVGSLRFTESIILFSLYVRRNMGFSVFSSLRKSKP